MAPGVEQKGNLSKSAACFVSVASTSTTGDRRQCHAQDTCNITVESVEVEAEENRNAKGNAEQAAEVNSSRRCCRRLSQLMGLGPPPPKPRQDAPQLAIAGKGLKPTPIPILIDFKNIHLFVKTPPQRKRPPSQAKPSGDKAMGARDKQLVDTGDELEQATQVNFGNDAEGHSSRASSSRAASGRRWLAKCGAKEILFGLTGSILPGQVTAIMGPTGAGKTSLLSVIAGRSHHGLEGEVMINGRPGTKAVKKITGYVMQQDHFFAELTVEQSLRYSAELRIGRSASYEEKMQRVEEIIGVMGLQKCRKTRIGDPFNRGISGGEMKRTNIANELLANPALFVLDEPTSGLDASTAASLVDSLVRLARDSRRTVVCSIHQPSSQTFEKFDQLIAMADGYIVYQGPARECHDYFWSIGHRCPIGWNMADFLMCILNNHAVGSLLREKYREHVRIEEDGVYMRFSKPRPTLPPGDIPTFEEQGAISSPTGANSETEEMVVQSSPSAVGQTTSMKAAPDLMRKVLEQQPDMSEMIRKFWDSPAYATQVWALTRRAFTKDCRKIFTTTEFCYMLGIGVLCGFIWFQRMKERTENSINDRLGLVYFITSYWTFFPAFGALTSFPLERVVIAKERSSKAYPVSAYVVARTLSDFPVLMALPSAWFLIVFGLTGFEWAPRPFFGVWLTMLFVVQIAAAIGQCVGCMIGNLRRGQLCMTVYLMSTTLANGFLVKVDNLPVWIRWVQYISHYTFSQPLLVIAALNGHPQACGEPSSFPDCPGSPITPEMIIKLYYNPPPVVANVFCLIGMFFFFKIVTYLALRFGKNLKL